MKRFGVLFTLTAITAITIWSCGSTDILKRKYMGGFYVNHSRKLSGEKTSGQITINERTLSASASNEILPIQSDIIIHDEINLTETSIKGAVAEERVLKNNAAQKNKRQYNINQPTEISVFSGSNTVASNKTTYNSPKNTESKSPLDEQGMNILMLVLCLLVPPIAVYLKAGKTNGWFWLTLILCLLSGGIFAGISAMGSGWFIAFIIALLFVLEII